MKKADFFLLARGYISELIFSTAILVLLLLVFRMATIVDVVHDVAGRLAVVTGGLAAASFSMLGVYFSQTSSEFGKYLSWRGVSTAYLMVFGISAIYHVVCTICLVLMTAFKSNTLAMVCVFMLSMVMANVVSMICNLVSIIRLRDTFNKELQQPFSSNKDDQPQR